MQVLPYHKFDRDGNSYVLNVERVIARRVSRETEAALDRLTSDPNAPPAPEVVAELSELKLEEDGEWRQRRAETGARSDPTEERPITDISLFVSQQCNMRCVYCYGSGGEYGQRGFMEEATALRAVDWLIAQSGDEKEIDVCFFGGEPLLNFPLIRRVVEYALERGETAGKKFGFIVATNLSVLDDEKIAFLKAHDFDVHASFDGPPEVQNANRPFRDGRASYEVVATNARRLLLAMPQEDVFCQATICGSTDPQRVVQAIRGVGFPGWLLNPPSPCILESGLGHGDETGDPTPMLEHVDAEAAEVFAVAKRRDWHAARALGESGRIGILLSRLASRRRRYHPCGAGRGYVAVAASGDVFVCHRFVGLGNYRLGSVFDGRLDRSAYQDSPVTEGGPCAACWAKYFCAGGCMYENAARNGSVREPSPSTCRLVKHALEAAIRVWCDLDEGDRRYFKYVQLLAGSKGALPLR